MLGKQALGRLTSASAPQAELAEKSEVSLETIKRLEGMRGEVGAHTTTVSAIESALKAGGIEIISNGGPGVRLKAP